MFLSWIVPDTNVNHKRYESPLWKMGLKLISIAHRSFEISKSNVKQKLIEIEGSTGKRRNMFGILSKLRYKRI